VVRSLARRVLCRASDSAALRATVSSNAFLGPRTGTRSRTGPPRRSASHSSTAGASGGSSGTSTSRGMAADRVAGRAFPFCPMVLRPGASSEPSGICVPGAGPATASSL